MVVGVVGVGGVVGVVGVRVLGVLGVVGSDTSEAFMLTKHYPSTEDESTGPLLVHWPLPRGPRRHKVKTVCHRGPKMGTTAVRKMRQHAAKNDALGLRHVMLELRRNQTSPCSSSSSPKPSSSIR